MVRPATGSVFDLSGGRLLTNLFGDFRDAVAGQIEHQEVLEAGDEVRDLLQSGPVELPLLDLVELDQTARQDLQRQTLTSDQRCNLYNCIIT